MSDSLRDQLLKAGFTSKEPVTNDRKNDRKNDGKNVGKKNRNQRRKQTNKTPKNVAGKGATGRSPGSKTDEELKDEQHRKALKEQIKQLIEAHCVKEYAGTEAYAFLVGKRVRQLFVTEEVRKRLSDSHLVITRLNGNTFLVPPDIGDQILALNPQWAVFRNNDEAQSSQDDADYADFQVPDDLIW